MTIIKIDALQSGQHPIESQSDRTSCWLEGYIEVPDSLVERVEESLGWCNLDIRDGVLVGITSTAKPDLTPVKPPPTELEKLRADLDYLSVMTGVSLV